jgi:hypothetical protein
VVFLDRRVVVVPIRDCFSVVKHTVNDEGFDGGKKYHLGEDSAFR